MVLRLTSLFELLNERLTVGRELPVPETQLAVHLRPANVTRGNATGYSSKSLPWRSQVLLEPNRRTHLLLSTEPLLKTWLGFIKGFISH